MVPVGVREQHRVEPAQRRGRDRAHAAQVKDARAEHRIGDQPDTVEVDDDGRVPNVRHVSHIRERTGRRCVGSARWRARSYGEQMTWHPERPTFHPVRLVVSWLVSAAALFVAAAIVPGVSIEGFGGALVAALLIAILNAVLPPIVAGLRLPFMALLGFVLVLVLDALMLQLAAEIRPEAISVDDFGWALLAALVAAAVSVVLAVVFGTNDDDTYTLRGRPANREATGWSDTHGHAGHRLPRDRRPRAARFCAGRCATAMRRTWRAGWPRGAYELTEWEPDLSSQTGASQAGILLGSNHDIPAFRWVDKPTGRIIACSGPDDCAEIERERATGIGLLTNGGVEPRQPPVRRGGRGHPHGQPHLRGEEVEPRLPRVLRQRLQRHALARPVLLGDRARGHGGAARARRRDVRPRGHRGAASTRCCARRCASSSATSSSTACSRT